MGEQGAWNRSIKEVVRKSEKIQGGRVKTDIHWRGLLGSYQCGNLLKYEDNINKIGNKEGDQSPIVQHLSPESIFSAENRLHLIDVLAKDVHVNPN